MESWIILGMRPTNEKGRYNITSSPIGWEHSQNIPCCIFSHDVVWRIHLMCCSMSSYPRTYIEVANSQWYFGKGLTAQGTTFHQPADSNINDVWVHSVLSVLYVTASGLSKRHDILLTVFPHAFSSTKFLFLFKFHLYMLRLVQYAIIW